MFLNVPVMDKNNRAENIFRGFLIHANKHILLFLDILIIKKYTVFLAL